MADDRFPTTDPRLRRKLERAEERADALFDDFKDSLRELLREHQSDVSKEILSARQDNGYTPEFRRLATNAERGWDGEVS